MTDYLDYFNALTNVDFEEKPVLIEEFVSSKDFLGLPPLSEYQFQIVRAMSQIYKYDTLVALYGEEAAEQRFKETCNEIILQLGKGSGKDYTSTIAVAYVVYLLLCLKDPADYFGKPPGDSIDIINVAVNSDQAKRVFFDNLANRIKKCPWFDGRYGEPKNNEINFDKNINIYSGHSEREAFEGYNTLMVILDEISAFALESTTGHVQAKTAPEIYKMYRGSITSRYPDFGKLVSLSWPRFEHDFIQTLYDGEDEDADVKGVVIEKDVVDREHTFKRDPDLPDGFPGNEFTIRWEEDHIIRYRHQKIFALRRPSWEVNPLRKIEDYKRDFDDNMGDALGRFACMPSNLEDGFFKDKDAIQTAFTKMNGVDKDGVFHPSFQPKPETRYFVHVDLAQKHDHCAVAIGHVEKWIKVNIGSDRYTEVLPFVVVDAVRWWTPTKDKSVDFKDVVAYIKSLRRRGFELRLVTFDRWNSHDTMKDLERNGIKTDVLSVAKKHYDDFLSVMYSNRLVGPDEKLLKEELGQLRLIKDKVDHPRKGSKDLSDAVCGAIFNAVAHTSRPASQPVEAITLYDLKKQERDAREQMLKESGVIHAPPNSRPPQDIADYLSHIRVV